MCSDGKQEYNVLHLQRVLLFLNHCHSKKKVAECSYVPITELLPADVKSDGHHPFPQVIHCLVGERNRSKYLESLFQKLRVGLTQSPSMETANGKKNGMNWPPVLQTQPGSLARHVFLWGFV